MKIDRKLFNMIYSDALKSITSDKDVFIRMWSIKLKEMYEYSDIIECIGHIWDIAHMSMRDVVKQSGLTQKQFAERFMIPIRTVESWCMNTRKSPEYVKLLICESLGLLSIVFRNADVRTKNSENIKKIGVIELLKLGRLQEVFDNFTDEEILKCGEMVIDEFTATAGNNTYYDIRFEIGDGECIEIYGGVNKDNEYIVDRENNHIRYFHSNYEEVDELTEDRNYYYYYELEHMFDDIQNDEE